MSNRCLRMPMACLAAAFLLFSSGCVKETVEGDTSHFAHEWWAPWLMIVGGLAVCGLGYLLRNWSGRLGFVVVFIGLVGIFLLGPDMISEYADVSPAGFEARTGTWFMAETHKVDFDQCQSMSLISEESRGRRGRTNIDYYLVCHLRGNQEAKVPIKRFLKDGPLAKILQYASQRGIEIIDRT